MQHPKARSDGWTVARQLAFLDALARTRSVTRAAAAAGMSRESAHRLRKRDPGGLFAALWDRAIAGHRLVNIARAAKRHLFSLHARKGHEVGEVGKPRSYPPHGQACDLAIPGFARQADARKDGAGHGKR